ncbi:MAG: MmcQ/YjbR family DNA-binding protein [Lactovum sp.]
MTRDELINFCGSLSNIYSDNPFVKMEKNKVATLVFRHLKNKKIFLYLSERQEKYILSVKLEPEKAENLRRDFESITAAWHMNKTYWSDIQMNSDLSDQEIFQLIEESYQLTK